MNTHEYVMYGWAFNPPHQDHGGIIRTLLENTAERVIIIPTGKRDDKEYSLVSDSAREDMIRLATEEFSRQVIVDTTFLYGDILTTTLNQARYLEEKYQKEIPQVFGSDVASRMMNWDITGYVAHKLPKVFISRPWYPIVPWSVSNYRELEYLSFGYSSTWVREEVKRVLDWDSDRIRVLRTMVHGKVCDYILENHLFCSI
jgi:nicotinic acid mononucleotide adenylyltransferase